MEPDEEDLIESIEEEEETFPEWGKEIWITISDGSVLKGVVMLDKNHQEIETPSEAEEIVAINSTGEYYLVNMSNGIWDKMTIH